jgi:hypothetical protein
MPDKKKKKKHKHKSDREEYQVAIPGEVQRPNYEAPKEKHHVGVAKSGARKNEAQPANVFKNKQAAVNVKPSLGAKKKKGGKVGPGGHQANKAHMDGALRAHLEKAQKAFDDVGGGVSYQQEATQLVSTPKYLEHVKNSRKAVTDDLDSLESGGASVTDVLGIVDQIAQEAHEPGNELAGKKSMRFRSTLDQYGGEAFLIVGGALAIFLAMGAIGTFLIASGKQPAMGYCFVISDVVMAATIYKCAATGTYWM